MAEQEQIVELQQSFYQDSFGKVVTIIISLLSAIALLIGVSAYLYLNIPPPTTFPVDNEWRVKPGVPLNEAYIPVPDLLQWISDVMLKIFVFDFIHYNDQVKATAAYFTDDGYKVYLNQLNNVANYDNVQAFKMFISVRPAGAPVILNQGLLSGRYAWWIQMPLTINYTGNERASSQTFTFQVLIVRVPTLNNLTGVAIDNIIVTKNTPSQLIPGSKL